jgi:hypothetical protein
MDAIGVATVSVGGFLLYASIKGLHPWQLFTQVLSVGSVPGPGQTGYGAIAPGHTVNAAGAAQ